MNWGNNSYLWILIILLILGTGSGLFSSSIFKGCGWPILVALAFCMWKNGTLGTIFGGNGGCGCNN